MKKTHFFVGKNHNTIGCIGLGVLTAVITSIALSLVLTSLIAKGNIEMNGHIGVFLTRVFSVAIGGIVGTGLQGKKLLPIIIAISTVYLVILLVMGAIVFDAAFQRLWMGTVSVFLGAAISLLFKLKPQRNCRKAIRLAK